MRTFTKRFIRRPAMLLVGTPMTGRLRHRVLIVATFLILVSVGIPSPARGGEPLSATLDYAIEPKPYDNVVRAAPPGSGVGPLIAVDRNPASPFYRAVYLFGPSNQTGPSFIIVRSLDGGQTFAPPYTAHIPGSYPGITDVVIGKNGTLFAAAQGGMIYRSGDAGFKWELAAQLGSSLMVPALTVDDATGALYVAWSVQYPGLVYVASSRDGGRTWSSPMGLLSYRWSAAGAHIAAFSDRVVVTFVLEDHSDPSEPGPFVAALVSSDGGRTWGTVKPLSLPGPCMSWSAPSVAASAPGIFAVSWYAEATNTLPGNCWDRSGSSTEAFVSVTRDGGRTFSAPIHAGGPPVWQTIRLGDATVFDDRARLFVTWHSLAPDKASGAVSVANSTDLLEKFDEASFTTQVPVAQAEANSTAGENLAAGPNGTVYLAWTAVNNSDPKGPSSGVFVRTIAGQASGALVAEGTLEPGTVVDLEFRDSATNVSRARAPWNGSTLVVPELPPSIYDVVVHADNASARAGSLPVRTWGRTAFKVHVSGGPVTPRQPGFPWIAAAGIVGAIILFSSVLAGVQYTHITRESVLQRKVRLLMYERINEAPGSSFSAVRDAVGLRNGVASYHLRVLERQGLVHSKSHRRHRWYYPNGDVSLWRDLPLSPLQASLVSEAQRSPGIGVLELSRAVNRSPSSVLYNVKALAREGLLRTERAGRKVQCFPATGGNQE